MILLLACSGPATVIQAHDSAPETCDGPTWTGFADGFFRTWCQSCHSSTSVDRNGAPEALDYETYDQVIAGAAAIRSAVLDRGAMPLGGGVYSEDLASLEAFLDCPTYGEGGPADVESFHPEPTLSGEQVLASVERAFPVGDVPDAYLARERVDAWVNSGTGGCPHGNNGTFNAPFDGCETEDGWWFAGLGVLVGDTNPEGRGSFDLTGDFVMRDPDGVEFRSGGIVRVEQGDDQASLYIVGTWADGSQDTWIRDFSGTLDAVIARDSLTWVGGISRGDDRIFLDVVATPTCTDGRVMVRDVDGWHVVDLECSCGVWSFEGDTMGELCVDLGDRIDPLIQATGIRPAQ